MTKKSSTAKKKIAVKKAVEIKQNSKSGPGGDAKPAIVLAYVPASTE